MQIKPINKTLKSLSLDILRRFYKKQTVARLPMPCIMCKNVAAVTAVSITCTGTGAAFRNSLRSDVSRERGRVELVALLYRSR
jgi:hypothetical protein